jgi:hypothetical protein
MEANVPLSANNVSQAALQSISPIWLSERQITDQTIQSDLVRSQGQSQSR